MEERTGLRRQNESQIGGEVTDLLRDRTRVVEKQNDSQIGEDKTERESDRRKGRFVGAAKTSKEPAEWSQCHRESSWQVRQSRPCQKEKEQSRLSKLPGREMGESQGEREPHLGKREKD